jgi:hypothetical protein
VLKFSVKPELTDVIENIDVQDEIAMIKNGETPSQMIYTGE